jgi:SAM-dependent methyltransferase
VKNYQAKATNGYSIEFVYTCVEPVQAMREKFASILAATSTSTTSSGNEIIIESPAKSVPKLKLIEATAQSLPLDSSSVDVILAAQAFHWFSKLDALKEFHRALQAHGALALVWNYRDRSATLNNEIESILDEVHVVEVTDPSPRFASGKWRDVFNNQPYFSMPLNEQICKDVMIQLGDAQMIIDRVLSTSSAARRSADSQKVIRQRVLDFLQSHPELSQNGQYAINNSTLLVWTFKNAL